MANDLPGDELFIGQVVALLPIVHGSDDPLDDDVALHAALAGASGTDSHARVRARTYSVVTYAYQRGIFMFDGKEIDVSIRPLDVDTPLEAAVFRITSISGRSLRVKRTVAASDATAS